MTPQEKILRACTHDHQPCEVNMGKGEILWVCSPCWNSSIYARRSDRKAQLADYWAQYVADQRKAMFEANAHFEQPVQYFCRSTLGFGGLLITGRIVANRNGVAVVRFDRTIDGKKQTAWNKGWTPRKEA